MGYGTKGRSHPNLLGPVPSPPSAKRALAKRSQGGVGGGYNAEQGSPRSQPSLKFAGSGGRAVTLSLVNSSSFFQADLKGNPKRIYKLPAH